MGETKVGTARSSARRASVSDRTLLGRAARERTPRSSHAGWAPAVDRADPIDLLEELNATRVPWLVPIRHLRMGASPFTFYRGTVSVNDLRSPGVVGEAPFEDDILDRFERQARGKTHSRALRRLTVSVDGRRRIRSDPPVLFALRDLPPEHDAPAIEATVLRALDQYAGTLNDARRSLLERYTPVDIAMKVGTSTRRPTGTRAAGSSRANG